MLLIFGENVKFEQFFIFISLYINHKYNHCMQKIVLST